MDVEIIAFDVFGTLVDWRTSITAELARVGERAGIHADWPVVADAWRSRYQPALESVLRGDRPFQPLDVLHAMMLDEVASEHGLDLLRSEEHTSELQSPCNLVCRLLLEKKKKTNKRPRPYTTTLTTNRTA